MAIDTQKLLPSSGGSIVKYKSKPNSTIKTVVKEKSPLLNILKKTTLINKSIKGINSNLTKFQNKQKRNYNRTIRKSEEDRLESKPDQKKSSTSLDVKAPQKSFLDRIKQFLTFTFLGWLFNKTSKYLPKLIKFVEFLTPIADFILNTIGSIGKGIATFIEKGYELADSFKKWKSENIDGTNFEKIFNPLIDNFETFSNLALIAGLLSISSGSGDNDRSRRGKNDRRRGGRNIRQRGGRSNRPGNRFRRFNPFRKKPRVTGTGRDRLFRNPFRKKPTTTGTRSDRLKQTAKRFNPLRERAPVTSGRGTGMQILKDRIANLNKTIASQSKRILQLTKSGIDTVATRAPQIASKGVEITFNAVKNAISKGKFAGNQLIELAKPIIGKIVTGGKSSLSAIKSLARPLLRPIQGLLKRIPIVGALIDFGINTFLFGDPPGKAAFKAVFSSITAALGGAIGSIIPGPGTIVGATLGGIAGDRIGDYMFNMIFNGKNSKKKASELELNQFNKGGTTKEISEDSRRKIARRKKFPEALPTSSDTEVVIGKSVPEIRNIFPEADISKLKEKFPDLKESEFSSPLNVLKDSTLFMNKVPYYGPLFDIFGNLILGNNASDTDIKIASLSISSLIGKVFNQQLKDGKTLNEIISQLPKSIFTITEKYLKTYSEKLISSLISKSKLKSPLFNMEFVKIIEKTTPASSDLGGKPSRFTGNSAELQKKMYDYLTIDKKLSRNQALGILANIARESNFIVDVRSGDDGGPGGLFQWKGQRALDMEKVVTDWETNWKGQIDYALREPGEPGPEYINTTFDDPVKASYWWMEKWERPASLTSGNKKHKDYLKGIEFERTYDPEKSSPTAPRITKENIEGRNGYKPSTSGNYNIVQYITGDPDHPNFDYDGHGTTSNYHEHIAFKTIEDKEAAKSALREAGIQIGSEYRPGDPGFHGANLAIDVPGGQWGGSGAIGPKEYAGSRKVRQILGLKGGNPISKSEPKSFKSLREKTSYENSMIILIKREREIVQVPINNQRAGSVIMGSSISATLTPEKFKSFIK